jgi:anti-anti-sigma regulatory factor
MTANLICEAPSAAVRVARFARPDVRAALYDREPMGETGLYRELRAGAVAGLPAGGAVVLNFGLVDWFPSQFYRFLLHTRDEVRAAGGRLLVCGMTANVREGFELMGGGKQFEAFETEARALAEAAKGVA